MIPTIDETYEELRAVWRHYDGIHHTAEHARSAHETIKAQVDEIRRAYLDDIYADPQGKVKFSNQERREAEAQRRLVCQWPELVAKEEKAAEQRRITAAELERSEQGLKTMRSLAALVEAHTRMETVVADVASMPRMVRR